MSPGTRMPVSVGTRIGPYEIVGWLGAGGMGDVYRARDPRLGRDVAIKLIADTFATDASRVHRFEQEARSAGQLNHPNILVVYDAGVHDGVPYLVSELLEGESLRSRLQSGPVPPRKALDYARQTAEGLAAAHDQGIVHRDVKPDNLFVTSTGRIKILDFGIAKLTLPRDEAGGPTGLPTDTAPGTVVGTAGYMSPEQVRGDAVDARSDIFSVGTVLYEMLTGQPPFRRETAADTMAAILKEEPADPLPASAPPALARIISRCMEKAREARFQSARDLAFGLEVLTGTAATAAAEVSAPRRWWAALGVAIVVLAGLSAAAIWLQGTPPPSIETLLAKAKFSYLTDFEGSELDAAISPDGRFVVFMADTGGPFHVWLKQIGTGPFLDRTQGAGDQRNAGPNRSVGFSPEGPEIWLNGSGNNRRLTLMPLMGGAPRTFLVEHAVNVVWSPDGTRLVYFTFDGDPLIVADKTGGNAHPILPAKPGNHNHFPAWSPDGQWIYYTHGNQALFEFDVWRIPSAGGTPEQLTDQHSDVKYLTPIDARTVLYVAPDRDRSGPWLWALDVEQRVTHRVSIGLERYLSVAASADGRRLVATIAKSPTVGLWSAPILDRLVEEADVKPFVVPTVRPQSPRVSAASLYYLAPSGAGEGLFRMQDGQAAEVWKGADEPLIEAPAISPRGDRVVVVLNKQGKERLTMIAADGADRQSLAEDIDVRGTSAWSPDAKWIVTGGSDAQGPGLFKIPADGGKPVRLVTGVAIDPVWSPTEDIIVYAGQQDAHAPLRAIRQDGHAIALPPIKVLTGGRGRWRFLPNGKGLVYMQGLAGEQEFWLLDLATNKTRRIANLPSPATTSTFDISLDGRRIIFDRLREQSDIALIDLPK